MSLASSKGWLREQFLEGKIVDTLESIAGFLDLAHDVGERVNKARTPRARKAPQTRNEPEPDVRGSHRPPLGVIDTEGTEVP